MIIRLSKNIPPQNNYLLEIASAYGLAMTPKTFIPSLNPS